MKITNCPNCGANEINDGVCAYCGTLINKEAKSDEKQILIEMIKNGIENNVLDRANGMKMLLELKLKRQTNVKY